MKQLGKWIPFATQITQPQGKQSLQYLLQSQRKGVRLEVVDGHFSMLQEHPTNTISKFQTCMWQ
jgi:hypothetical protein